MNGVLNDQNDETLITEGTVVAGVFVSQGTLTIEQFNQFQQSLQVILYLLKI